MPVSSGKLAKSSAARKPARGGKVQTKKPGKERSAADIAAAKDEEMDIAKPLYPLGHYVHDRAELIHQTFRAMSKKGRLAAILPDVLQDVPVSDLKKLCLQHLEVMSKKRIRRILSGDEMDSSSGTEDSGNECENDGEKPQEQATATPPVADSTSMELNATESCFDPAEQPPESPSGTTTARLSSQKESNSLDMLELHPESEEDDNLLSNQDAEIELAPTAGGSVATAALTVQNIPLSKGSSTIAKTCMEILELELRARAIKSLLKSQPINASGDQNDDS